MPRLVSKAEIASTKGVSKAAVTQACRPGHVLHPAMVGQRVDLDHSVAVAYLGSKPTKSAKAKPKTAKGAQAKSPTPVVPPDIAEYADLTLRQILTLHGTETALKDFLSASKTIEEIREKRLKIAELEGKLISRELVEKQVFGTVAASHLRLLADAPRTLTAQLYQAARAGLPEEDGVRKAKSIIEKNLKGVVDAADRALKRA